MVLGEPQEVVVAPHPTQGGVVGRAADLADHLRAGHGVHTSVDRSGAAGPVVVRRIDLSVARSWSWEWLAKDLGAAGASESPHLVAARVITRGPEEAVLVRPFLAGQDIRSWARSRPGADLSWLPRVLRELFGGLAALHRLGLVHGGLKPSNMWITPQGDQLRLLDALVSRTQLAQPSRPLAEDDVRYLSPEQAGLVHRTVGFAADLYAAGWVLLEAVAEANGTAATLPRDLAAGCGSTARIHRLLRAVGTPRQLVPLFGTLLAALPEDRYESAEDVLAALETHDLGELARPGEVRSRADFEPGLVGRQTELDNLIDHVRAAARGAGVVACLSGEAGIGKSRLLEVAAAQARVAGLTVLRGSAFDQTARRPLGLFQTVFADLASFLRAQPEEAAEVVAELGPALPSVLALVPALAGVFPDARPAEVGALDAPGTALASAARLITLVGSRRHPALLVVDDCQWADDLSWQLLARIASAVSAGVGYLTLTCSCRPEALAQIRSWDLPGAGVLRLGPLTGAESRLLVEAMVSPVGPVPDELINYVVSHSSGNPLHAVSTLRALVDAAVLHDDGERWAVDPARMRELPPVPVLASAGDRRRTEAFVAARLAHLSPATLQVVRQAAVLGRQFSAAMLSAALGTSENDPATALAEAVQRGILRPVPAAHGVGDVEFTHDRLREAALHPIDPDERRSLHARAAAALNQVAGARYDYELAYHLHHSGQVAAALHPALRAAESALLQHALDVAETNLEIASAGLDASAEATDRDRFRVYEGLGRVHMLQGNYDRAAGELETAYRTAPGLGDLESARVATLRGELAFKTGELADAEVWTERAMAALRMRRPGGPVRAALASVCELIRLLLGWLAARVGRPRSGDDRVVLAARLHNRVAYQWWFARSPVWNVWVGLRALRFSHACGGVRELAQALSLSAAISAGLAPGLAALSMRLVLGSLRLREAVHDEWGVAQSNHFRGFVLHAACRYREAIGAFDTAIAAFEVLGDRWEQIAARWQQALCLYRLGQLHEAGGVARETFWEAKRIGDRIGAGTALAIWVRCLPSDVSTETVRRELELTGRGDRHTTTMITWAAGWKLLHMGELDAAERMFQEADRCRRPGVIRNHFLAPMLTSRLHAQRLWCDTRPAWSALERRRGTRAVYRRLFRALGTASVFAGERPAVLRELAMVSFGQGRSGFGRLALRAAVHSARRAEAHAELAACCQVAEVALGPSASRWAPLRGLPPAADVCRRLRLRVDRGVVETLSLRVLATVADKSRHQAVLTAARRLVTSEEVGSILAEVREAASATTTAVAVDVVPLASLAELALSPGVDTERVVRPITPSGPTPLAVVADFPFGEAVQHEQTVDVLATLAGAVLERQALRRESAERMVEVQEAERGRIARDLHDELGHLFAGILEGTSAMGKAVPGSADGVRELAKEGIRAVRMLAWTLRPDGLDDLGLVGCVEQLVEDCERMFGVPVDLTTGGSVDALPDAVQTAVFRIVQEALTNVGKHAGASEASVLLVGSGGRLRAVVEDNGAGFEPVPPGQHRTLGLSGMRERARLVGGRVEIESRRGVGTTVMVEVPINDDWCGGVR